MMARFHRPWLSMAMLAAAAPALASDLPPLRPGDDILGKPQHLKLLVASNQLVVEPVAGGGVQITCLCGPQISLAEIPLHVRQALIAIEDRRFADHNGFDPIGMGRGLWRGITGRRVEGGSTITQQLCKNRVLNRDRALMRKGNEVACAYNLETVMGKDEVLHAYLNGMEFGYVAGRPVIGIEQAARVHFGKRARDLNPLEGAMLAGMMKATGRFNPTTNRERSHERALTVLAAMEEVGYITAAQRQQHAKLKAGGGKVAPLVFETRYFSDWVLRDLAAQGTSLKPGMRVALTFEALTQAQTQQAFTAALKAKGVRGGDAVRFLTMKLDGRVVAMMGGWSYAEDQSDGITGDRRQPASTFKPFIYAAALEKGLTPDSPVLDRPKAGETWSKAMLARRLGRVTLAEALARSANIGTVRLLREVGFARVEDLARRVGITAPLRDDESLALGTSEVSLIQMASGFAAFANGGVRVRPHGYVAVVDASGDVVSWPRDRRQRAMAREVAAAMKRMLQQAVSKGTGQSAAVVSGAGGKTGTSNRNRDAWFVGFTSGQVTAVWAGVRARETRGLAVTGADMAGVWAKTVQSFRRP